MFRLTKLVTFAPDADGAQREAVTAALREIGADPAVRRGLVEPTLPGVYNGGDLIAHFQFAGEADWRRLEPAIAGRLADAAVAQVDSAAYDGGPGEVAEPSLRAGVYRTLLLCIERPVEAHVVAQFEAEMTRMAHYIPAIRNWRLSRVSHAGGARRWTHVWEQEYADIGGLTGPYMAHPYHWAHVDRWFDPECREWMIDTRICHSFCALAESVI